MKHVMQARSSSNGQLYTWQTDEPDFAGDDYEGPGTPQEIAVLQRPPGVGGIDWGGGGEQTLTNLTPLSVTSSRALLATDLGKALSFDNASAITATVPTNADVAFPVGTVIFLAQGDVGQLTIAAAGGVTIQSPESLKLRKRYASASLLKIGTNTWRLTGDLELA